MNTTAKEKIPNPRPAGDDQASESSGPKRVCPVDCPRRRAVMWLVVAAQFLIAATICLSTGNPLQQVWTAIVFLAGVAVGVWAIFAVGSKTLHIAPMVRRTGHLVTGGPYRWIRHPMYTALLLFCGSFVWANPTVWSVGLWIALVFVLAIKIYYEEQELRRRYPEYDDYAKRTPRLIPFLFVSRSRSYP